MALITRTLGRHPFIVGFLGVAIATGTAVALGTSAIFALFMAMLGFLLGAAAAFLLSGRKGDHDEIDAAIREGRGAAERVRQVAPYDLRNMP